MIPMIFKLIETIEMNVNNKDILLKKGKTYDYMTGFIDFYTMEEFAVIKVIDNISKEIDYVVLPMNKGILLRKN